MQRTLTEISKDIDQLYIEFKNCNNRIEKIDMKHQWVKLIAEYEAIEPGHSYAKSL